jgi:hypothetical protein
VLRLTGRWRIVAMDLWEQDAIDLAQPGFIEFRAGGSGQLGFVAVQGEIDWRPAERSGRPAAEFTWAGADEGDEVSGHGWAVLAEDGSLSGHLFFHLGDDSGYQAERMAPKPKTTRAARERRPAARPAGADQ